MNKENKTEKEYDEIMTNAEKIYLKQKSLDNPYAMHWAFEYAERELSYKKYIKKYTSFQG